MKNAINRPPYSRYAGPMGPGGALLGAYGGVMGLGSLLTPSVPAIPSSLTGLQLWDVASAGLSTDGAVSFVGASSQSLSIVSNSTLQTGNVDFGMSAWVNFTSGQFVACFCKSGEYYLDIVGGPTARLYINNNSATIASKLISGGGWRLVVAWFDSGSNTTNISVNGGPIATINCSGVVPTANSNPVYIGNEVTSGFSTGTQGQTAFWKRKLNTTDIANLYNSGAGIPLEQWPSSLLTSLVSVWQERQPGNLGFDTFGANTMTPTNVPTYVAGNITGTPSLTGDAVSKIADQSTAANNATQTTGANRYTLQLSQINGKPGLKPIGTTGSYTLGSSIALTGTFTLYSVCKRTTSTALVPMGSTSAHDTPGYLDSSNNADAVQGSNTVSVGYTGSAGWIALRFRRDASNVVWVASSGMAEVSIGTLAGTITINDLFARVNDSIYTGTANEFAEQFLTNTDAVTNGQDATISRPYILAQYGLTIP